MTKRARILVSFFLVVIIVSCAPNTPEPEPVSPPPVAVQEQVFPVKQKVSLTQTPTPRALSIYYAPEVPDVLVSELETWGIPFKTDPQTATLHLELASAGDELANAF